MMDLEDGEVESSDNEEETKTRPPPPPPVNSLEFPEFPDDDEYVILDRPKSSILPRCAGPFAPSSSSSANVLPGNLKLIPCGFEKPPAPSPSLAGAGLPKNPPPFQMDVSSSGSAVVDGYGNGKEAYYKNLGVSDLLQSNSSDDKDSSGSDDDSDCGAQFGKRSRMILPPRPASSEMNSYAALFSSNPNAPSAMASTSAGSSQAMSGSGGLSMFQQQASQFQKQRKPNTIWSSVIQEEQIANIFETAKLDEVSLTNIEVERGPETYRYHRPLRQPRLRRASDSSEISSDGLSDNAFHYLRGGMSYEEEDETEESSEHSLPKAFTGRSTSRKATGVERRISDPRHKKVKRKVLGKLRRLKSAELAEYMGTKLQEQKVHLLGRAVDILGKDKCIHIFLKTLKIEKRGGLMIKNQERRRTPGGVFLYLIRGDPRFPKSLIDLIFRDERLCENKFRKKKVATTRLKRKGKLESEKDQLEFAAANKKDDSYSDDTAIPWQEQSGTDTGQLGDESSVQDKDTTDEFSGSAEMQCDG